MSKTKICECAFTYNRRNHLITVGRRGGTQMTFKPHKFIKLFEIIKHQNRQTVCESCGTKKGVRRFYPPVEQLDDDEWVYFCSECFMSDDIQADEPMTDLEKLEEWNKAIEITNTIEGCD